MFYRMPPGWTKSGLKVEDWDNLPEIEKRLHFCKDETCLKELNPKTPYAYNHFSYCSEACMNKAMVDEHNRNLEMLAIDQGWV